MYKDSYKSIFDDKKRVLVVFSHPDDAEVYAGGTIARLAKDNKEVVVVKMTLGNKGSRQEKVTEEELSEMRLNEDKAAMQVLGIKEENNVYLNFSDGSIENDNETIEKLAFILRKYRPDIVITHNPEDIIIRWDSETNWINHKDHRNTGKSVVDACYPYSRDILFFPHHFDIEGIESHTVTEFLFVDYYDHPDTIAIDVTETIGKRIEALAAHSSQYSIEDSTQAADFFTNIDDSESRYERFRYVIAD